MYSGLLMLVGIFVPLPIIIKGIKNKDNPFSVCVEAMVVSGILMALIVVMSSISGHDMSKELIDAGKEASLVLPAESQEQFMTMYRTAVSVIPATMLILSMVAAYVHYVILSKIVKFGGEPALRMPSLRESSLPQSAINACFLIYIISWVIRLLSPDFGQVVYFNVTLLVEFIFALQGIGIILLWTHLRKIPKVVPIMVIVVLWLTPIGKTILFLLGLADLFFGLRKRISSK